MKKILFSLLFFSSLVSAQELSTFLKDKTFELQHFIKDEDVVELDFKNPYDPSDNTYRRRPYIVFTLEDSFLKADIIGYCNITFATYSFQNNFLKVEERGGTTLSDCGGDEETDYFTHLTGNFYLQNLPEKVYYSFSENEKILTFWVNENHKMVFQQRVLSVKDFSLYDAISIYPNPSEDILKINYLNDSFKISKIKITDFQGRTIAYKTKEFNSIDIKNLSKGIYFLKVETEENLSTLKKFIKK